MASLVYILLLLHAAQVYGGFDNCNPHFNCLTCTNPYSCETCAIGRFWKRAGAYYECASCDEGCVSCEYYSDCQECVKGRHGEGCELHCSTGCVERLCEQLTGACICNEHFTGSTCDSCTRGRYGADCQLTCSDGCYNETCDKVTGECACVSGYTGLNCSECLPGRYGRRCQNECNSGCRQGTCDTRTGHCSCKANFTGDNCARCVTGNYDAFSNCSLACPLMCIACDSEDVCTECNPGHVGEKCTEKCMDHCTICSTSKLCQQCESGYWASNCLQPCPRYCVDGKCDMSNGTCTSGCQLGYHGRHCECNEDNMCTTFDKDDTYSHAMKYNPASISDGILMVLIFHRF